MVVQNGFELLKEKDIPELNTSARLYLHLKTGAELLSLENSDENKVFGITFRTPPNDSTGVAHIMEHSVLCGSEKYPLKEPFIELVKGSLKTFLNAMTYPDKTCYPVASQNLQDFYNLIDVYMDAVLHPLIFPTTLQQEGWHYEVERLDAPLVYKGVVFNEMKGAYSNPDDILQDNARMSLFPDTPYRWDAGGDPRCIPDLTYEQFKAFHDKYYHPSNSRIYFYGDDDPQERLRLMDAYLMGFERIWVDSSIPIQQTFSQPRFYEITYDPGEGSDGLKGMLVMNWLFNEGEELETSLGLSILEHILIGTPASPLRKALIDSGLGEDLAGVGLEAELLQPFFSTGLKGVLADEDGNLTARDQIEGLILDTLRKLVEEGIDPEMVAAAMNTVEFRLRENNTGSFPQGLLFMLRSLTRWLYEKDPFEPLAFEAPLTRIKAEITSGSRYFERMILSYYLDNPHRTTVVLVPKKGFQKRREDEEKERLAAARAGMNEAEINQLINQTQRLKALQEQEDSPEALAKIPRLKLQDLDQNIKRIPLEKSHIEDCEVLFHDFFTNGILYIDLGFDLHVLPQELVPIVPLFGRALLEMGTEHEDYIKLSQRIGRSTGGIRPMTFTSPIYGLESGAARLFLRAKATSFQTLELMSILKDILQTARLDQKERFIQIAYEEKAGIESRLAPAGHQIVNTRLRAMFNEADWAAEQMSGIEQLFFLRRTIERIEQDWASFQKDLERLRQLLLQRCHLIVNVTTDEESWFAIKPMLRDFLAQIPLGSPTIETWSPEISNVDEGLTIPTLVNYVGKGMDLFSLDYLPDGSIEVITNYLRTTWLWERVRVRGGAYGGFCQFNQHSGVFSFISYRDPNLLQTLDVYDQTEEFLRNLNLDHEELTKSVIGAIGEKDMYQLPDARGFSSMVRYLVGDTDERRQVWRDQILGTSVDDFRKFGDILKGLNEFGNVVVLGSLDSITRANALRGNWLKVNKIL